MEKQAHTQNAAQAVVLLKALAQSIQNSPHSESKATTEDLISHITGMQEAIVAEANVNADVLDVTEKYALDEWRAELVTVLFEREHRQNIGR